MICRNQNGTKSDPSDSSSVPILNTTFPSGTYSFDTVLTTVNTNCTSNTTTWRCYPYSTYSESESDSGAIFYWIVQPISSGSDNYYISSTQNPFMLTFTNVSLTLEDAGAATERYTFNVSMQQVVYPTTSITSDNNAATCYYNSTTFQASLYTSMEKSYASGTSNSSSFEAWPYAIRVEELSPDGPDCMDSVTGARVNVAAGSSGESCDCLYSNYDV